MSTELSRFSVSELQDELESRIRHVLPEDRGFIPPGNPSGSFKVYELIEALKQFNPDASVYIQSVDPYYKVSITGCRYVGDFFHPYSHEDDPPNVMVSPLAPARLKANRS